MFDITQRKLVRNATVRDIISILEGENLDAKFYVDGLNEFYIHITDTNECVAFDLDSLDSDCYWPCYESGEHPDMPNPETLQNQDPVKVNSGMSRLDCFDLLSKIVDNFSDRKSVV